jgi:hypothetical protein
MSIRDLHTAQQQARHGWRSRPNGYALAQAASRAFGEAGEALRQRLPFRTTIAYAYSPRENVGSSGGDHILCVEAVTRGRLRREAGDALCKPRARFWGLDARGDGATASCLRCLELAERIVGEASEERKAA